jgi:uracil-DNA glycosylase family 4
MTNPLKRHLEMERLFGADFLPLSKSKVATPAPTATPATQPAAGPAYPADFLAFRDEVLGCTKCGLCSTRTQVVFGVGALGVPLLFVGEAPGQDEDLQGEPFVGRAGQLLTKTLKELGVERRQVYIGNILKCRPPGNRTPQVDEMAACMPWLVRQIAFVKPKIICGLGNIAVQTLLDTKIGITRLRGKYAQALGVQFFPTFHPAYILRNMSELKLFREDLRTVCKDAGLIP